MNKCKDCTHFLKDCGFAKADKLLGFDGECVACGQFINKRIDTENKWISCSEKLPRDGIDVLVWFEYFRFGEYNRLFQTMGISCTYNGEWSGFVNGSSGWRELNIIAWQPLPEPYNPTEN